MLELLIATENDDYWFIEEGENLYFCIDNYKFKLKEDIRQMRIYYSRNGFVLDDLRNILKVIEKC